MLPNTKNMKKRAQIYFISLLLIKSVFGQVSGIEVTFTAIDSISYIQLDSIKVMNRTLEYERMFYWPDTVVVLDSLLGIFDPQPDKAGFQVLQNYPNPMTGFTTISLYIPEKDKVSFVLANVMGRIILKSDIILDRGIQMFRVTPGTGNQFYFTAWWRGYSSCIQILQTQNDTYSSASMEYQGSKSRVLKIKTNETIGVFVDSQADEYLYVGYANGLESGILDAPEDDTMYFFQFAANIPCIDIPTVEYEGQVYNTVQIFSQCWLVENLNVGAMIPGEVAQSDNGALEKYCYNNNPDSCSKYGGLYEWDEMMQYTTLPGVRGICPPYWHIPTDEEWKVLEGSVDSLWGIGDYRWDWFSDRGFDAGKNLKTVTGWYLGGNGTDKFGFSGLPAGTLFTNDDFYCVTNSGCWWTSTEAYSGGSKGRGLSYEFSGTNRSNAQNSEGFSVRCLKD